MRSSPVRKNKLLILARTARPLAEMACEAGFEVAVIDLFGDEDTRHAARATTVLQPNRYFDFKTGDLLGAIAAQQSLLGPLPIVCGSAFERVPATLAAIARHYRVLGCEADVYRQLLDLPTLFDTLRRKEDIATPITTWRPPSDARAWLRKRVGGSGGYHVESVKRGARASGTHYFQARENGASLSALFIANGRECRYYGCAEHLRWHGVASFRYEGARRLLKVPGSLSSSLERIGAILTARLALRGCFGIDFLCHEDQRPLLLDINPRPTASLELWPERHRMFSAHFAACTEETLLYSSPQVDGQRAQLILYADAPWQVAEAVSWPSWVADRPRAGTSIARGAPLCTLFGEGATRVALEDNLQQRYRILRKLIDAPAVLPAALEIRTR